MTDTNTVGLPLVVVSIKQTKRLECAAQAAQRRISPGIVLDGVHTGQTFLIRGQVVSRSVWYRQKKLGFPLTGKDLYLWQLRHTYLSPFAYTVS